MIIRKIYSKLTDNFTFLSEFFAEPKMVGALGPSSPKLSEVITSWVDLSSASSVVEFGPGTGAFTRSIQKKINPNATFIAIEINPKMAKILRRKHPDIKIYNDSVLNTASYLSMHGYDTADCIISGLPWASFNERLQTKLLDVVYENLNEEGQFVTFTYIHSLMMPSGRKFKQKLYKKFAYVSCSKVVWENLPPALVFQIRK